MNRLFRFLIVGLSLLSFFAASAQPSFVLNDEEAIVGDEVEIVLSVQDFGNISTVDLSLKWDTSYLAFNMVSAIANIADLSAQNIGRDKVDNGYISLGWAAKSLPDISPDDGEWFLKLSFTTKKNWKNKDRY